jgi:hypothetical protein
MNCNRLNFILLCCALFFLSCFENKKAEEATQLVKVEELQLHLNTADIPQNYYYEIVNSTNTTVEVENNEIENESKIEMDVAYSISRDSLNYYDYQLTYKKFKVYVKALDQEKEIDADDAGVSLDPMEKIYGAFKEAKIHFKTDSLANVIEVNGFSELFSKMRANANGNKDALEMVDSSLSQYSSKKGINESFQTIFNLLPKRDLKKGDSWIVKEEVSKSPKIYISNKYTVKSIEKTQIILTIDADVNLNEQATIVDESSVLTSLSGTSKGEIKIERATGILLALSSKVKLKGESTVSGRVVPIELEVVKTIRRTNNPAKK